MIFDVVVVAVVAKKTAITIKKKGLESGRLESVKVFTKSCSGKFGYSLTFTKLLMAR